jgi:hypothetical protein
MGEFDTYLTEAGLETVSLWRDFQPPLWVLLLLGLMSQVHDFDVAELASEILRDETAMAFVRFWLTAQEASLVQRGQIDAVLRLSFSQERAEPLFVFGQVHAFFL